MDLTNHAGLKQKRAKDLENKCIACTILQDYLKDNLQVSTELCMICLLNYTLQNKVKLPISIPLSSKLRLAL